MTNTTTTANRDAAVTDRRAAKLLGRDEDYREITYWFRESFKPHAKAQNRRNRRNARRVLKGSV
jgi:hypothetical protein